MMIRRMRATFGTLEDQTLVLQPGLNIIDGTNESGKSTWRAFLTAMFYGIETRERAKGGQLPDKQKYRPWNGHAMAGSVELCSNGRNLTLERSSQTAPFGDFRAWDSDTGEPLQALTGKTCGQSLLGVEAGVYTRSGMILQKQLALSSDPNLEKRLNALVTTGSEDYAYAELDQKLKKMETALSHNPTGALPKARIALERTKQQIGRLSESRFQLAQLEAELQTLKVRRDEQRKILAGLNALEQQKKQERLQAAQAALEAAVEDRLGWEAVCAEFPEETTLLALQNELQQLQNEFQNATSEPVPDETPEPDPVFGTMDAKAAHDQAAADALLVHRAARSEESVSGQRHLWLILPLLGLIAALFGVVQPDFRWIWAGGGLAAIGLAWRILLGIFRKRRVAELRKLQQSAQAILTRYETRTAKGVIMRGMAYIRSLEDREFQTGRGLSREELESLTRRRERLFARLETVMPGCGSADRAAVLFQEAAQSRQALERAKHLEAQCIRQLEDLRSVIGSTEPVEPGIERFASFERKSVIRELEELESQLEALASRIDRLFGAMTQMGDYFVLTAEQERLEKKILRMEQRQEALALARTALREAEASLRARFAPLLCKRAGELFHQLTDGRYDQIQLDRELHISVHPTDSPVFRSLSYLSGGTVDQLYLALRLAICELLLPGAPIVLDDALVYFDDRRALLTLKTLLEMSKTRQILLFTCQSREKALLKVLSAWQSGGAYDL